MNQTVHLTQVKAINVANLLHFCSINLHNYSYTKNCLDMVKFQYTIPQQITKTCMWAKRACSQEQREIIPTHVKLLSYLLQMTEGLIIGSDRLGALWVEVKTLCGFKPCLVSISVESGNDTEDVFPVGLVAGVPWIGEWHGEVRGEIFGGIPGKRKVLSINRSGRWLHEFTVQKYSSWDAQVPA